MWQGQEANQDKIFNPKNIARGNLKNKLIDSETKHPAAGLRYPNNWMVNIKYTIFWCPRSLIVTHTRFLKLTDSRGPGSPTNAHRAELFLHAGGAGRVFFAEISRWYAEQLKCLIYIYM